MMRSGAVPSVVRALTHSPKAGSIFAEVKHRFTVSSGGYVAVRLLGAQPLVDADSHVTEPADLWTSRVPKKCALDVPRVDLNPATKPNPSRIGANWLLPAAGIARAGRRE